MEAIEVKIKVYWDMLEIFRLNVTLNKGKNRSTPTRLGCL